MKTIANMFMGLRIQSTKIMLVATLLVTGNYSLITVTAQVTIGSLDEPAKGALLELKTQTNLTGGATTDKGGLLLPRVQLQT
ncbi:MAG: hypothetical protein LBN93_03935, partial [Candidatus Symbiothrix sp.]|nr:hypothetical protein [Candidatus Symbiothrix sp.]